MSVTAFKALGLVRQRGRVTILWLACVASAAPAWAEATEKARTATGPSETAPTATAPMGSPPSTPVNTPTRGAAPGAAAPSVSASGSVTSTPRLDAPSSSEPDEAPIDVLPYDPARPIPEGFEVRQRYGRGRVIAGSIVFGVGYSLSFLGAVSGSDKDIDGGWLLVPVFGPLIAMATQRKTCTMVGAEPSCAKSDQTVVVLGLLASMQVVGASLFTWGITSRYQRLERKETATLSLGPSAMGQAGYGISAVGSF